MAQMTPMDLDQSLVSNPGLSARQDFATISKAAMKFKLSVKEKDKLLSEEQKRLLGGDLMYTMTFYLAKGEEYSLGTCPGWSKKTIFRWQNEAGPRGERGKHWPYFF